MRLIFEGRIRFFFMGRIRNRFCLRDSDRDPSQFHLDPKPWLRSRGLMSLGPCIIKAQLGAKDVVFGRSLMVLRRRSFSIILIIHLCVFLFCKTYKLKLGPIFVQWNLLLRATVPYVQEVVTLQKKYSNKCAIRKLGLHRFLSFTIFWVEYYSFTEQDNFRSHD